MEKDILLKETISDLFNLSINELIQIKSTIDNLNSNENNNTIFKELDFKWEGALSNEKSNSIELQKEALNWR